MNRQKRKKSSSRQANRRIFRRTVFLLVICGVVMFLPIVYKLWYWQISRHDEIEQKAVQQQTSELSVSAQRGAIYDAEGNVLAISASAYDVILSPKAINDKQQELDAAAETAREKGEAPGEVLDVVETIATGLAEILDGVDADTIREKCQDTNSQYKKIATKLDATTEEAVREFMDEYDLSGCIYLTPNSKRYYPYSTLAAQIIGFTNDNGGAYGIEAELDDELSGTSGLVVTAQNASGTDLLNFYQEYYDAESGSTVTLTLSTEIQKLCEDALADGVEKYDAQNGGFIIVMDCDSGAILGMASSPTYDLNDYSTIIDSVLQEEVESGAITESEALNEMWRNKALNDTYEPGSTFKSLVLAAALQEGTVSESTTFNCSGSVTVSNYTIRCSNRSGHGLQTLAEAVGNSCNPAFISIGQSLGAETFYSYMERFGLMDSTGIDLPGESANVIWSLENFGITELATASFGQRFTVTPISLITAINAVVNGGYLYTPHVVQSIVDADGDTTYEADTTPVRQVISEETSQRCATILEGVVTSFTGRNAYMSGYRIGGKTGTSQTLVDDEYIVSFMGFAPADDPEIIVLVAFDSPKVDAAGSNYSTTGYYISGGNMAAPVAGQLIADILDYMGYEKQYTDDDLSGVSVSMPALAGLSESEAAEALEAKDLSYRVVGDGETVTDQCPASGSTLPSGSEVILYMGEEAPDDTVTVPDLTGMTVDQAKEALSELNLYMTATGSSSYYNSTTLAYSQSTAAGTEVERGSVITVNFADSAVADYTGQEIDD
ncbi:MAG: PASTA domain-containing protein [Clostridiales bacterium]|nr:PASTA domain-containing protein [Clostridiales bacterium]